VCVLVVRLKYEAKYYSKMGQLKRIKSTIFFILFFCFCKIQLLGFYGHTSHLFAIYYGPVYRTTLNSKGMFYNSFNFGYEKYSFSCTSARVKGCSGSLDYLNNNDFQASVSFFKCIKYSRNQEVFPYLAISPTLFRSNKDYGCNLKPEIGIRFFGYLTDNINVLALTSYGYDIPIVNESMFNFGRHNFTIKLGLGIDISSFKKRKIAAKFGESESEVKP